MGLILLLQLEGLLVGQSPDRGGVSSGIRDSGGNGVRRISGAGGAGSGGGTALKEKKVSSPGGDVRSRVLYNVHLTAL